MKLIISLELDKHSSPPEFDRFKACSAQEMSFTDSEYIGRPSRFCRPENAYECRKRIQIQKYK